MSLAGASHAPGFELDRVKTVLGDQAAKLITSITSAAHERDLPLYLAGGVARDLLLSQPTLDLDLVVEGDAIGFARSLARVYGGQAQAHQAFGTAKWRLDEAVADKLGLALDELPAHVDFVTARGEIYERPTALPSVSPSDIGRDLRRRDFSVNAIAIQLSPAERAGGLLDPCGGGGDLKGGLIRALHDQSFVDDPTRILRAHRYAGRLRFTIEPRTGEWMRAALPLLAWLSGQRLRNEIDAILREPEAGAIMLALQSAGALIHIHPAFALSPDLSERLARCQRTQAPWTSEIGDRRTLRWILLMSGVESGEVKSLCERLALTKTLSHSIEASASLLDLARQMERPALRPSEIAQLLDGFPEAALQAGWLLLAEKPAARDGIAAYAAEWRQRRSLISGDDLKAMGVAPGPRYRQILDRLRFAWIDGELNSAEDEFAMLQALLSAQD